MAFESKDRYRLERGEQENFEPLQYFLKCIPGFEYPCETVRDDTVSQFGFISGVITPSSFIHMYSEELSLIGSQEKKRRKDGEIRNKQV